MDTNILSNNLKLLKGIEKTYNKNQDKIYPIEETKSADFTLKINNIYFHSKYNPVKEAKKIADMLIGEEEKIDVFILFGLGLGYIANEIFNRLYDNKFSNTKFIIIEKDINIFLTSLQVIDWSNILNNKNVQYFIESEKEKIGSFIQSIPTKKIRYYYHRPSYQLHKNYYTEIQNYITYVLDRKDMNNATFLRFQKLWHKNAINNLPYYESVNFVSNLTNKGQNLNAAIIAGGPTLEQSIDFLKNNYDDLIIICVDTAYKFLKNNDITPDIIVTIDPQFWNFKYLENENITDSIIIADLLSYKKVFQLSEKYNYFVSNSIFDIGNFFTGDKKRGTLAAGGSVSTSAFDIARILNVKNIFLCGLDLSFPERKTHFKGAFFEKNFLTFCDYFIPAEKLSLSYLTHADSLYIPDTDGGKVISDPKMLLFKKWFDREIPLSQANVYQFNLKGAQIIGTKLIETDYILNTSTNSKKAFKNNITSLLQKKDFDKNSFKQKINTFLQNSEILKNKYKKIISLITDDGIVKDANKIQNLENEIHNNKELFQVSKILSAASQDILIGIMENIERNDDQLKSTWITTKVLYQSIIEHNLFFSKNLKIMLKLLDIFPNI